MKIFGLVYYFVSDPTQTYNAQVFAKSLEEAKEKFRKGAEPSAHFIDHLCKDLTA